MEGVREVYRKPDPTEVRLINPFYTGFVMSFGLFCGFLAVSLCADVIMGIIGFYPTFSETEVRFEHPDPFMEQVYPDVAEVLPNSSRHLANTTGGHVGGECLSHPEFPSG